MRRGRSRSFIVPAGPAARPAGMKAVREGDDDDDDDVDVISDSDEDENRPPVPAEDDYIWRDDWRKLGGSIAEPVEEEGTEGEEGG
eukprot:SAG22_NODE_2904_length_2114_cov_1.595533_2_plen_86_part_00